MTPYVMGQLAGMQKSALSTKGWARLLGAMRKEAPWFFSKPRSALARLRGDSPAKYLKRRFPQMATEWTPEAIPDLRKLEAAIRRGKAVTGPETQASMIGLGRVLGISSARSAYNKGPVGGRGIPFMGEARRSILPRAAASTVETTPIGRRNPEIGRLWRATTIGKLGKIKPGTTIWATGEPGIGKSYAFSGGEMGGEGVPSKLLLQLRGKRGARFKPFSWVPGGGRSPSKWKPGTANVGPYARNPGIEREMPFFETTMPMPEDPLGNVTRAWRVQQGALVPIRKTSLRRWIEAVRAPEVLPSRATPFGRGIGRSNAPTVL